jgi:aspartyl protease family protein
MTVLSFARLALVVALSAFVSAGAVMAFTPQPLRLAQLQADSGPTVARADPLAGVGEARKAPDGHFWAWAKVNGEWVRFLVDTGATAVALTPADAARLGFKPADLDYVTRVATAGGSSRAASVTLASVAVGEARIDDVTAVVVEHGLDTSLLGMSYLGRLTRFEATREALILRP